MELKKILAGLTDLKAKGNLNLDIQHLESDSRKVTEGTLFVAVKGFETDGHEYIGAAIQKGAIAVMVEEGSKIDKTQLKEDTTIIVAPNTRHALAIMACNFYQNPSRKFKLIGITGTKGKTTTSFMIKHILEKGGLKVGLIGTIAKYIGNTCLGESSRTTPDSLELQQLFSRMAEEKVDVVVMEVSSQSLKLERVTGCNFDIAIFTNFLRDHISPKEHPTMEDYFNSKLKLFYMCKKAYINADDFHVCKLLKMDLPCEIKTYGIDNMSNLLAKDITVTNASVDFKVKIGDRNERVKACIPGRFSVYNALAAISVANAFGINAETIKESLAEVRVPGRSELVDNKRNLVIMIDYAHTPESLENILHAVKTYTKGHVICVFGCGGDRDSKKRPLMGEVAGQIADYSIITSDNPRTEDPNEIIKEIETGMKKTNGKYICIEDRKEAIQHAIEMATKKDLILLAGKGHEPYQEINGVKHPFDERVIVRNIIEKLDKDKKNK